MNNEWIMWIIFQHGEIDTIQGTTKELTETQPMRKT
jgi:hypothetical protein